MSDDSTDYSVPDDNWPLDAVELYEKLIGRTVEDGWAKVCLEKQTGDRRAFVRAAGKQMFTYAMFLNREKERLECVASMGLWCEGFKGHVHGGAISTLHDAAMATLAKSVVGPCVTVNLNVNFKNKLPLCATTLSKVSIDRVDGRKVYLRSVMTDPTGEILYSDVTAIFVTI